MSLLKEIEISCPLCRSGESEAVFDRRLHSKVDGIKPLREEGRVFHQINRLCRSCGLVFVSPRLDGPSLLRFYSGGQEEGYQSDQKIDAAYVRHFIPLAIWRRDILLGEFCRPGDYHLDVGANVGALIHLMREGRVFSEGLDPNGQMVAAAKHYFGIDLHQKSLEEYPVNRAFDLLTLNQVLEHVSDPVEFLRICLRHVKEGGYVYLEVPDLTRPRGYPLTFFHPHHIQTFTEHTLKMVCHECGMETLKAGHVMNNFLFLIGRKKTTSLPRQYQEDGYGHSKAALHDFLTYQNLVADAVRDGRNAEARLRDLMVEYPWPESAQLFLIEFLCRRREFSQALSVALTSLEKVPTVPMWNLVFDLAMKVNRPGSLRTGTAGRIRGLVAAAAGLRLPLPRHKNDNLGALGSR